MTTSELLALLLVPALIALVAGLLLPFAVRPLLHRWNLVDIPTARSSHSFPVFRGMGLATALAAVLAYLVALIDGQIFTDRSIALFVLFGMMASGALGWMEDYRGVSIKVRFAAQLLIGAIVALGMTLMLGTSIFWVPLGVFAIAAYINVVNFMDGINGISGLHGFAVGGAYAYAGWVNQMPWLLAGGAAVAAAYLAFLPWNVRTGKNVFLGDAGSYFLGGAIASMAVGAFLSGVYVEYILAPLLVYLVDTGTTLLRRIVRGEQWYKPHRSHAYQRLTDVGFSHLGSAALVTLTTFVVTAVTVMALPFETQNAIWSALLVVLILALYIFLPTMLGKVRQKNGA
ncbi:glycosyltransferase family 4 protein [Rothia nasimurium]|uniref:MraY family glycosyltransferase n=1 Tax=Rothia nasimurium TaxID=85336 RepID=UPI002DD68935|nr:glycosyltransferase family 4 protein [Rothia nasimurium]